MNPGLRLSSLRVKLRYSHSSPCRASVEPDLMPGDLRKHSIDELYSIAIALPENQRKEYVLANCTDVGAQAEQRVEALCLLHSGDLIGKAPEQH